MTCSTCGRENPSHLTFCQECGQRLGPRIAPPTPPIGLGANGSAEPSLNAPARASTAVGGIGAPPPRALAAPEGTGDRRCKVCDTPNGPNLRYCTSCGSTLDPRPNLAAAPSPVVVGSTPPPHPPGSSPAVAVRECSRCKGRVDATAQFCKFCGNCLAEGGPSGVTPLVVHERLDPSAANGPVHGGKAPVVAGVAPIAAPMNRAGYPLPVPQAPLPSPSPIVPSAGLGPSAGSAGHATAEDRSSNYGPSPGGGAAVLAAVALRDASRSSSPAAASRASAPAVRGRLVVIAKSGADGPSYPFGDLLDVGREEGNVVVQEDPYLSPRHVRIHWNGGKLILRDLGSTNGVYLRLAAIRDTNPRKRDAEIAIPLEDQDFILVGQQVLRFDILKEAEGGFGPAQEHGTLLFGSPAAPRYARLCQRTVEGISRDVYYVRKVETVLGRESGDVVFTEDPFLSRRHAAIRLLSREASPPGAASRPPPGEPRFALVDLGSSNGTFLRIRGDVELTPGDHFRVGQQLFRVDFDGGRG